MRRWLLVRLGAVLCVRLLRRFRFALDGPREVLIRQLQIMLSCAAFAVADPCIDDTARKLLPQILIQPAASQNVAIRLLNVPFAQTQSAVRISRDAPVSVDTACQP
jgi:hypothetical protein